MKINIATQKFFIKMLTALIANFCNTFLGRYIENLDTDQICFSLLQGKAELRNLSLKNNALANLGLPLIIHSGFVGKLRIDMPVTQMTSRSWLISFEQLYLVAGPKNKDESYTTKEPPENDENMESFLHKKAALDLMEAEWKSNMGFQGLTSFVYGLTFSAWLSHVTSLVTNVVQNIELKVKDVHVRFEDPGLSFPGSQFAFGLQIHSFTAQTCDNHWKPSHFVASSHEIMFKLAELEALSVYWDTCTEIFADLPLNDQCKKMKYSGIDQHEFILMPSNARVRLKRNCSTKSLQSMNQPRLTCDLQIDLLEAEFRDTQYVQCCKALEILSRFRQRKFKPRCQWKFAGECIVAKIKKKRKVENWPFIIRRVREIIFYVRNYKEYLLNPKRNEVIKLELQIIEADFQLEELLILRSIVMKQISKEKNVFRRWYNNLFSWWSTEENYNHFLITHTIHEKRLEHEILEMLGEARRESLIRKEDMLSIQLNFRLKNGSFRLSCSRKTETTESSNTLLELELLDTAVEVWKSNSIRDWIKLHVNIGNVLIRDRSTIYFKKSRRSSSPNNEASLFDFIYEKQPPDSDWNHRLYVNALATEMIYKHSFFLNIKEHFPLPRKERSLIGQSIRKEARSRFKMVKLKATKVLKQTAAIFTSQESWDLLIDFTAPRIQIVESSFSPVPLTVDLGHFHVNRTNLVCAVAGLASFTLIETPVFEQTDY